MKLIAISVSGEPSEPVINLPDAAREVGVAYQSLYEVAGYQSPWLGYFAIVDGGCIGTCGFKSPPENNRVEIAYFTFPDYEGKGVATQMAKALVTIAVDADPHIEVAAQTLPVDSASTTILRKLGFENAGTVIHPEDGEVWEWRYAQQSIQPAGVG
ncbi:MAG: GNAT family N-acetyltransferase [Anaerolineales bacterium]|nr:GNAT family N-acetyltransferase [Anaerolineales bacterium]